METQIPKLIWQTYKLPYNELPEYALEATQTWTNSNPDWIYNYMDDEAAAKFIQEEYGDEWLDIWNNVPVKVMKGDIWRYMIVYKYGGLYADLDTHCVVPIGAWLPTFGDDCKFVVCVENACHMANWAFIGTPGHPFLKLLLDMIKDRIQNEGEYHYKNNPHFVHALTANGIFSEAYIKFIQVEPPTDGLVSGISSFNESPVAKEHGIYCATSPVFFHTEVIRHLYGSQVWNDGRYVRWIAETPVFK